MSAGAEPCWPGENERVWFLQLLAVSSSFPSCSLACPVHDSEHGEVTRQLAQ